MDKLVELVCEYQKKQGWNNLELCIFLGIRPDSWARIKNGKRGASMSFRKAVWEKLPQLREFIFST